MKANVYSRPAKPLWVSVKQRDDFEKLAKAEPIEIVAVDKATECHVTPDNVADRMVSYLGPTGDYLTLEPSAGTGQLTKALLRSGHSQFELTQIERHIKLAPVCTSSAPSLIGAFSNTHQKPLERLNFRA